MKNQFIVTLLFLCISSTVAMSQTKKPAATKKPTTTVKTTPSKTTTTTKPTTTSSPVVTTPSGQTNTPTSTQKTSTTSTPSTTTTTQSSGPSKSGKVKEEKIKEPKPEKGREPKEEKVKIPKISSDGGGVRFGLRAEATQLVSFEQGSGILFSPGVNAGLIINIPFSETVSIQPEILYSIGFVKGDISSISGFKGDYLESTYNSLLAPITFNFNLGSGSTKFIISPGGYAEYLLSASSGKTASGIFQSGPIDLTGLDKFSYGAALGLGVKINGSFLIEARSFYDLKTSNNKSIVSTIGIGYMF
jgi:Outer membrane protein beta-barrel domain